MTEEPNFLGGIKMIRSDAVKADEIFVIDPAALKWKWGWEQEDPYTPFETDSLTMRLTTHMWLTGTKTVVETNPLDWARPRGLRGWLRRLRAIMGYSYREAAGTLRHYERIDAVKLKGFSV